MSISMPTSITPMPMGCVLDHELYPTHSLAHIILKPKSKSKSAAKQIHLSDGCLIPTGSSYAAQAVDAVS